MDTLISVFAVHASLLRLKNKILTNSWGNWLHPSKWFTFDVVKKVVEKKKRHIV